MKHARWAAALAAMVVATAWAADADELGDPAAVKPELASRNRYEQCSTLGLVFYRLAERRDAGTAQASAVQVVERSLDELRRTGSHLRENDRDLVSVSAGYVFKQTALTPSALGYFAANSCVLDSEFAQNEARRSQATAALIKGVTGCQVKFPKPLDNRAIGQCIKDERKRIEQGGT